MTNVYKSNGTSSMPITYLLPTYNLTTYLPINPPTYLPRCIIYLPVHPPTYLLTHPPTYLLTHPPTHLYIIYLLTYLSTHSPTYLHITYLPTY